MGITPGLIGSIPCRVAFRFSFCDAMLNKEGSLIIASVPGREISVLLVAAVLSRRDEHILLGICRMMMRSGLEWCKLLWL